MHAPAHFQMHDEAEIAAFVEARPFATLVINGPEWGAPVAALLPMLVTRGEGNSFWVEGHVSRKNPIAAAKSRTDLHGLAIFHGPDAYVTPSLYPSKQEHGRVVPTWNYTAVELSGELEWFEDPESLRRQVERLTDMMERSADKPWAVNDAPESYISNMLKGIIGMRLYPITLEGARKLSQNRSEADRAGVLHGFSYSTDPSARQLAAEMSKKA